MPIETITALAVLILTVQTGILTYCVRIEHRLTRLETIISLRVSEK